jgi:hypothetical protein
LRERQGERREEQSKKFHRSIHDALHLLIDTR